MGQQQLLLIILGVIIVGIAVAVGITMFQDNALSATRDAMTADLVNLASKAQQYYRKPASLGGGGNSFTGIGTDVTVLVGAAVATNDNATYSVSSNSGTGIVFVGTGATEGAGGVLPVHMVTVAPSTYTVSQVE